MGELVRRCDYERRASHLFKSDPKSRFMTKEFSQPVKSANALVQRSTVKALSNLKKEMKFFGKKHDEEKVDLEMFRKGLGLKSVNFEESRFQQMRCRSSMAVKDSYGLSADRILRTVPSNYVLDFGPGNRPIYTTIDPKKVRLTLTASDSQSSKPTQHGTLRPWYRSKSAFSRRPPRNTGKTPIEFRSKSAGADRLSQPTNRPGCPFSKVNPPGVVRRQNPSPTQITGHLKRRSSSLPDLYYENESVFEEKKADEIDGNEIERVSNNQKSYRFLREENSIKSKVLPDARKEKLKRLKNIELSHLHALGERVHRFTAGIHALASRRKYVTTSISPLRI